jgi:glycosyltransferase involved in cell wall biosynthesis
MFEVFSRIRRKHEVKIFCGYYLPVGYNAERELNIDGVITGKKRNAYPVPGYGSQFLSCVNEATKRISRFEPDVVIVNSGYEFVKLLSHKCKGKVIPYVGSTDWYKTINLLQNQLLWRIPYFSKLVSVAASSPTATENYVRPLRIIRLRGRDAALRHCKVSICVSKYVSRFLKQLDPKIRTKVAYPGVDHKTFKPTFEDHDYLLNVTRIHPNKNPMLVVNAVRETGYKLRIYANMETGIKSYDKYYRDLLAAKGSNVQIRMNKNEATIVRGLQECSLFLSPARNEGIPNVDLEAMACGKFVIGHRSGGQIEFLKDSGITCGDNPQEWRQYIIRLMKDRDKRIELGRRAHRASLYYTWDKTARVIQQTIEEYD